MKTLYNPTDSMVAMTYLGNKYEIAPKSELNVPEDVAEHWCTNIHLFLQSREFVAPVKVKPTAKVVAEQPVEKLVEAKAIK